MLLALDIPSVGWDDTLVRLAVAGAIPQRVASRMSVDLADGATSGDVLDTLERIGDLLALRRDGRRLEVELRLDDAQRAHALDEVSALPQVEEARWQN